MDIPFIRRSAQRWIGVWLLLAALSGCGGDTPHPGDEPARRAGGGVPSEELRVSLAAAREALHSVEEPGAETDLRIYNDLSSRIWRPSEREAAALEILDRWRRDPGGFLWIDLARTASSKGFLADTATRDSLFALPALNDTSTAVGCYALAAKERSRSRRFSLISRATAFMDGLPLLDQVWLKRRLSGLASGDGRPLVAVDTLITWLPAARRAGGNTLEFFLWSDIARDLRRADRLNDALLSARMAEEMAKSAGSPYRALQAGRRIAFILGDRGDTAAALDRYDACLAEARSRDNPALIIQLLNEMAAIFARVGDYRAALVAHQKNLALNLAIRDTANAVLNMYNISYSYRVLGKIDSCMVYQRRTEDGLRRHGLDRLARELTPWLAEYYFHIGNYAAIDSLLAEVGGDATEADEVGDRGKLLLTMLRQGLESSQPDLAYWAIGELQVIRDRLHDVVADYSLLADLDILSADFLAHQGELLLAAETLFRAREVVERHGGEYADWNLERRTFELALLGNDLATAAISADRCLEIALRRDDGDLIVTSRELMGRLALEHEDFDAARGHFSIAGEDTSYGGNHRTRLSSLINLGIVQSHAGLSAEAMRLFDQAAALFTERPPNDLAARLAYETGRVHLAAGEIREAETSYLHAHDLLTSGGRDFARGAAWGFHAEALREITEALIGLYVDAPELLDDQSAAERTLRLAEDCRWSAADDPTTTQAEHTLADPSGPVLVFFVGGERSFAWVIDDGSCTIHELPDRGVLEEALDLVLANLAVPEGPVETRARSALSAMLLDPVSNVWSSEETLFIVMDDPLASVPWYALCAPTGAGDVLDHGPIVVSPSVAALGASPDDTLTHRQPKGALLAVGVNSPEVEGPQSTGLATLHQAEAEARSVADLWRTGEVLLRTGADATWPRIEALGLDHFQVLHFATHAVAHQGVADRATLRFASTEGSQPLTLQTVRGLTLDADLIYLSCCEAARHLQDGSGVFSFARAFLSAGARAVIAPTIRVDDEASLFLAERFYDHWQGGLSKAAALRAALLDLRQENERWRHPFYWGFYRMIGAG